MDYKTRIKHAEEVAIQLENKKTIDDMKSELRAEGLYENDVLNIFSSVKKILAEKYSSKIKEYLLAEQAIHGSEEFSSLNKEVIDELIDRNTRQIASEEKRKITKLIKQGQGAEQVFRQVDTRFISQNEAAQHIAHLLEVKKQNSGGTRMLNIFGGIGLIVATIVVLFASGRLFYVLPIMGLIMIVKGLKTERMEYDS